MRINAILHETENLFCSEKKKVILRTYIFTKYSQSFYSIDINTQKCDEIH